MDVKRAYRSFKLHVARQFADLPDHIGAELEFMHFLSLNEGKFTTSEENQKRDLCLENERAFLEDHLQKWASELAGCLKENSDSTFFIALSQLTSEFLTAESKYLKGREEAPQKTELSAIDIAGMEFDTSTLNVLEVDEATSEPGVALGQNWGTAYLPTE